MENRKGFDVAKFLKKRWFGLLFAVGLIVVVGWAYSNEPVVTQAVLAGMVRNSTPVILGALCGLICERSGIVNIGIEGQMLTAAFTAFLVSAFTGNVYLALLVGIGTGMLLGLLLAFMSVTLKVDQIIGGTVINILALGLTGFFYQQGLNATGKFTAVPLGPLADIPLLGRVLFTNPPITYAAIVLVFVVHFMLFYTRWGLRTRAVGEHPRAADTVGINVFVTRYLNVIIAGGLGGLAGTFLTIEGVGFFERGMTNGRGFVALAVMIFGKWTPLGAWGAALMFGLSVAVQNQLQFSGIDIPHQFVGMLPYLLTIVVLAGFVGRARPPAAEGVPYEKEG
jgi:general nucleoside transport system permease protein